MPKDGTVSISKEVTKSNLTPAAGLSRFWEVQTLPQHAYLQDWNRILGSTKSKAMLRAYAQLTKDLAEQGIARADLDLSGMILLYGMPGTGKSTLARGFGNHFAHVFGTAHLFRLKTESLFSEWLGQSAKEIAKAFEPLRFSAQLCPTVLLVDEVEAISFARSKVIHSSDPSDLVRSVDQLLEEIDSLRHFPHTVVIGTSNFSEVIDNAFWDRADLTIKLSLPDLMTRVAILAARQDTLKGLGLRFSRTELMRLAQAADGLSGRVIGKLFAKTYCTTGVAFGAMKLTDVLATIAQTKQQEGRDGND